MWYSVLQKPAKYTSVKFSALFLKRAVPSVTLTNFYQSATHHAPQQNRPMTYSPCRDVCSFNPVTTAALIYIRLFATVKWALL